MQNLHWSVVVTVGVMVLVASGCGADGRDTVAPSSSTSPITPSTTAVSTIGPTTSPPIDVTTPPLTVASTTTAIPASTPSAWEPQDLGESPGESGAVAATNGSTTVLVAGFEAGKARAWVSEGGGEYSSAEIEGTDDEFLSIYDVVAFDRGFVAVGNGYPSFVPRLWRSADGKAWELVATTGLSEPADIHRLVSTPAGLVAVGTRRVGDEAVEAAGGEMFAPGVWASPMVCRGRSERARCPATGHVWGMPLPLTVSSSRSPWRTVRYRLGARPTMPPRGPRVW